MSAGQLSTCRSQVSLITSREEGELNVKTMVEDFKWKAKPLRGNTVVAAVVLVG